MPNKRSLDQHMYKYSDGATFTLRLLLPTEFVWGCAGVRMNFAGVKVTCRVVLLWRIPSVNWRILSTKEVDHQ